MPFLAPALPYIATGVSALGGALANRSQKNSSRPTIDPAYQPLEQSLLAMIQRRLANPGEGLDPLKASAATRINRKYADAGNTLATRLASRGFGGAGTDGRGARSNVQLELDRFGELGRLDTDFAKLQLDREDDTLDLGSRLLGFGRGQQTTYGGNRLGGAVDSGLSTLTTLSALSKLLKGGGGGVPDVNV